MKMAHADRILRFTILSSARWTCPNDRLPYPILAFEELTPTLLREMIEKIVVHECSYDENGTRRQDIEIYYSFVGKIDLPEA